MPIIVTLQDAEGNAAEIRPGRGLLTNPNNAWPGNVAGLREGYLTLTSTTATQARASIWADRGSGGHCSIVSSNANDDGNPVGTGARTVRVTYYSGAGLGPYTEDLTLNGTTAVPFGGTDCRFVEHVEVLTVGSNGAPVGNIDVKANNDGTGATLARVNVGENRTFFAHHWVPPGQIAYVTDVFAGLRAVSGSGAAGRVFGRFQDLLTADAANVEKLFGFRAQPNTMGAMPLRTPLRLEGPGLFVLWARADGTTSTEWFVGFSFYDE